MSLQKPIYKAAARDHGTGAPLSGSSPRRARSGQGPEGLSASRRALPHGRPRGDFHDPLQVQKPSSVGKSYTWGITSLSTACPAAGGRGPSLFALTSSRSGSHHSALSSGGQGALAVRGIPLGFRISRRVAVKVRHVSGGRGAAAAGVTPCCGVAGTVLCSLHFWKEAERKDSKNLFGKQVISDNISKTTENCRFTNISVSARFHSDSRGRAGRRPCVRGPGSVHVAASVVTVLSAAVRSRDRSHRGEGGGPGVLTSRQNSCC